MILPACQSNNMVTCMYVFIFVIFIIQPPYSDISVVFGVISGWTDLTCCDLDQAIPKCFFYIESRNIGHRNSSERCYELTVSGEELFQGKAKIIHCKSKPEDKMSQNVTITVWSLCKLHLNTFKKSLWTQGTF